MKPVNKDHTRYEVRKPPGTGCPEADLPGPAERKRGLERALQISFFSISKELVKTRILCLVIMKWHWNYHYITDTRAIASLINSRLTAWMSSNASYKV